MAFDGVTYWQVDVPAEDERLKDPEYIQLLLQGKLFLYPAVVQRRLRLPLYTMTRGGFWVATRIGEDNEIPALPLARSKLLIQFAYQAPGVNQELKLKKFVSKSRLLKTLEQAHNEEVAHLGLISSEGYIEKIEITVALGALTTKPHPGLKLLDQIKGGPS